ncbi:DNA cytosine methyltransferase [Acetobacter sp. AAB5]|uniref:DNA cytosine methyltransferase n=1 Tax=Acetobacter sp. AAB5 TaxID=3418370 RepID=UPI003CF5A810
MTFPVSNESIKKSHTSIDAVDMFCGAGGLTHGLELAGVDVRLGVDIDPACAYPYEHNNKSVFLLKSIENLEKKDVIPYINNSNFLLLAGCAPCQPFSTYRQKNNILIDKRWYLIEHFSRLIDTIKPHFVTMENVPRLAKQDVFKEFVSNLESKNFFVSFSIVNCADYGIPQKRNRLVLLASKLGPISLMKPTTPMPFSLTVRDAIKNCPLLHAGEVHSHDPLHQAPSLSKVNMLRIQASKPGGSWRSWDKALVTDCHKKTTGQTYPSVYGRMVWDAPSPTITTQYYGFGNGRFGHPEQDRAISLREGAILQSFPPKYSFVPPNSKVSKKTVGRLIGNAVPVNLGKIIGETFIEHLREIIEKDI